MMKFVWILILNGAVITSFAQNVSMIPSPSPSDGSVTLSDQPSMTKLPTLLVDENQTTMSPKPIYVYIIDDELYDHEIKSFVDFFQSYPSFRRANWKYLIAVLGFTTLFWVISSNYFLIYSQQLDCCWKSLFIITTTISVFFDVTSGTANIVPYFSFRNVYAVGVALHCFATPMHLLIPRLNNTSSTGDDISVGTNVSNESAITERMDGYLFPILFLGEFVEIFAIVYSTIIIAPEEPTVDQQSDEALTDEALTEAQLQLIISLGVLVLGSLLILIIACCIREQNPETAFNVLICGFQIIYLAVVIIAATSDWRRLLWLLPEVPLETIMLLAPKTGTRGAAEQQTVADDKNRDT